MGKEVQSISEKIEELNKKKSIKENISEMFSGFYRRFLIIYFSQFLEEQSGIIEQHMAFKETEEYKDSSMYKIMETMKEFGESSGYNDIFIPAMKNSSPSYDEYYQNLMKMKSLLLNSRIYDKINI